MAKCEKKHKDGNGKEIPHRYVAGVCIEQLSVGSQCFMLATYPYFESDDHVSSRSPDLTYDFDSIWEEVNRRYH